MALVIAPAVPGFDAKTFVVNAAEPLAGLELKARIAAVADALGASLPGPFAVDAPRVAAAVGSSELSGWEAWPALTWVERFGLSDPEPALDALAAMTGRASAEFAIRPYIDAHPELTWPRLGEWARSTDPDLRRLASEGTRPRLPWGGKVASLLDDPAPAIALLDLLYDDPDEVVRRSVANHVNDIARDDPDLALTTVTRWRDAGEARPWPIRHALRGLVKRGDLRALALLGVDVDAEIGVRLELGASEARIGDRLELNVTLENPGEREMVAEVDYAVSYARPSGRPSRRVFKMARVDLPAGETLNLTRRLELAHRSIRTLHPGEHLVELQVNGKVRAGRAFALIA